ncbi:MAG: DUF166 family protein [Candidatus Bathyarchaeia archaeon]
MIFKVEHLPINIEGESRWRESLTQCRVGGLRIYIIYRGPFGEQVVNNLAMKGFADRIFGVYELKSEAILEGYQSSGDVWSKLWEEPERYIPRDLPIVECDLLLVLGVHPKLGDLIPPIAERLKVKAVLYPIDDRAMAPEAKKTIQEDLEGKGIHIEFPEPFCTLDKSEHEIINEFAKSFGRPRFRVELDEERRLIKSVKVLRDTPSGTAYAVAQKLVGFPYSDREALLKKIYEEHHNENAENYCLAEMDPACPLMQQAGDLLKDAIFEACGWATAKDIILRRIIEFGEVDVKSLEENIVGKPGDWRSIEKACETDRTLHLYIDELVREGKIVKVDGRLKLLTLHTTEVGRASVK